MHHVGRIPQTAPLAFHEKNITENWRVFEKYDNVAAHYDEPVCTQAYILLNLAGSEVIERERLSVYAPPVRGPEVDGEPGPITTTAESKEDPVCLKKKFRKICSPQINITMERQVQHKVSKPKRANWIICHRLTDQNKHITQRHCHRHILKLVLTCAVYNHDA